jgi:hypothetical protein
MRRTAAGPALVLLLAVASCGGEAPVAQPGAVTLDAGGTAPDAGSDGGAADRAGDRVPEAPARDALATPDLGSTEGGSAADAIAGCPAQPALDLEWITAYQRDLIARLTGEAEIEPGLSLMNRGTPTTRAAAARYLAAALGAQGLMAERHDYGTGTNVFARLGGTTGGGQQVVLGAHFDSVLRTPGANDNATGVALVLAAGKALGALGCRSRPVLLVLFDQEEDGRIGSRAFARKLIAEQAAVHSVHTADQLGWDSNGDRLIELERPDAGLRALYEAAVRALGVSYPLVTTTEGGSDHASFRPDFPAVGITEGYRSADTTPHMHRPGDTAATVDFAYLRAATTVVTQVMADLVR